MSKEEVIKKTTDHAKQIFESREGSHDWWHIIRVRNTALAIAQEEGADKYIVELAVLLHDVWDHKFYNGDSTVGPRESKKWLHSCGVSEADTTHVADIIANMSFNQSFKKDLPELSLEGKVVQDADRLDATGAIGIARVFAYGGSKGREIYDPTLLPQKITTPEEYKNAGAASINHFYEKLLLLKDKMNTETAKKIAEERHEFMELFLDRFYKDWEGKSYSE